MRTLIIQGDMRTLDWIFATYLFDEAIIYVLLCIYSIFKPDGKILFLKNFSHNWFLFFEFLDHVLYILN